MSSAANHRRRSHRSEYTNRHNVALTVKKRIAQTDHKKEDGLFRRLYNKMFRHSPQDV